MTDKELLELAAKAAGIELRWSNEGRAYTRRRDDGYWVFWNPLTSDGDVLRLAVTFGKEDYFDVEIEKHAVQVTAFKPWEHCEYEEFKDQDPYAATRRAIVRAIAEIGKEMK